MEYRDVKVTSTWAEWAACYHAGVFSVPGVKEPALLQTAAALTAEIITNGGTARMLYHPLKELMGKYGYPLSEWKSDRLHHLYTVQFYALPKKKQQLEFYRSAPYWRFRTVMDKRTSRIEGFFHDKIFLWDSPVWELLYPPITFYGRARVETLSKRAFDREGCRLSEGELITRQVTTSRGSRTIPGIRCDGKDIWFNPNFVEVVQLH